MDTNLTITNPAIVLERERAHRSAQARAVAGERPSVGAGGRQAEPVRARGDWVAVAFPAALFVTLVVGLLVLLATSLR